jgi:HEAT repeat protein
MVTVSDVMKMKERKDVGGLIRALQDRDIAVRAEAASSLGQLGDQKAVVPLISSLQNDSDPYVRSLAAKALGQLGEPRARDALMACIANDTLEVSLAASEAQFQLEANIAEGSEESRKTTLLPILFPSQLAQHHKLACQI